MASAAPTTCVFFYGLNMDASVLAEKGVHCPHPLPVRVDDHAVVVRDKAILVRRLGGRAYGTIAALTGSDIALLYATLPDYAPTPVLAFPLDPTHPEAHSSEPIHALAMVRMPPGLDAQVDTDYLARWQAIVARLRLPLPDGKSFATP
jgi:hypothetical protein